MKNLTICIFLILASGCVSAPTVKYSRMCEETAIGAMLGAHIELGYAKKHIRLIRRENYIPKQYHVWVEVRNGDRWVPIGITGRFYTDAYIGNKHYNHIKIFTYDAAFDRASRLRLRKRRKGNLVSLGMR